MQGLKFSQLSVLVVDDDPLQLSILEVYFRSLGAGDLETAGNGLEALETIDRRGMSFDIIVSDLKMPEMDGLAFMRALKDRGFAGDLLIISSAGEKLMEGARKLAYLHGFRSATLVRKPLTRPTLDQAMAELSNPPTAAETEEETISVWELEEAIVSKRIGVVYQPKVEVWTGRIVGVEALARIERPVGGAVLPNFFVPLAETSDLIDPLTMAVLGVALRDMKHWAQQGCSIRMAFNVSMTSLHRASFTERLLRLIDGAGVVKNLLTCELTESKSMDNAAAVLESLTRFAINRIGISVDDFGTGFASMERLRDFAYSELKIDRSFAANAHRDSFADASVRASIVLGRNLGLRIVAEGIETREQLDHIVQLGVDEVQGFVIAKPMHATEFLNWYMASNGSIALKAA
jgi:EAL domain-containing protein (putative c-di-GMP-specific phosphodiesterase class I)